MTLKEHPHLSTDLGGYNVTRKVSIWKIQIGSAVNKIDFLVTFSTLCGFFGLIWVISSAERFFFGGVSSWDSQAIVPRRIAATEVTECKQNESITNFGSYELAEGLKCRLQIVEQMSILTILQLWPEDLLQEICSISRSSESEYRCDQQKCWMPNVMVHGQRISEARSEGENLRANISRLHAHTN